MKGLTSSFVEGKPVQVTDRYRLQKPAPPPVVEARPAEETTFQVWTMIRVVLSIVIVQIPEYECQRATLLKHHNHELTVSSSYSSMLLVVFIVQLA